eukprot:6489148-Amphidinium_carterae.1
MAASMPASTLSPGPPSVRTGRLGTGPGGSGPPEEEAGAVSVPRTASCTWRGAVCVLWKSETLSLPSASQRAVRERAPPGVPTQAGFWQAAASRSFHCSTSCSRRALAWSWSSRHWRLKPEIPAAASRRRR